MGACGSLYWGVGAAGVPLYLAGPKILGDKLGEKMRYRAAILTALLVLAFAVNRSRATMVVKPPAGPMRIEVIPGNSSVVIGNTQQMTALLETFRGFQQGPKLQVVS